MSCLVLIAFLLVATVMVFIHKQKIKNIELFISAIEDSPMKDQLDLFTFSTFSSDCCPSTYTSSSGCLCNYQNEHEAITTRGGNRTIYPCK
jgi:hypothetical protein